jgi:hypothetical protein
MGILMVLLRTFIIFSFCFLLSFSNMANAILIVGEFSSETSEGDWKTKTYKVLNDYVWPAGKKIRKNPRKYSSELLLKEESGAQEQYLQSKLEKKMPDWTKRFVLKEIPTLVMEITAIRKILTDKEFADKCKIAYDGIDNYKYGHRKNWDFDRDIYFELCADIFNNTTLSEKLLTNSPITYADYRVSIKEDLSKIKDLVPHVSSLPREFRNLYGWMNEELDLINQDSSSILEKYLELELNAIQNNRALLVRGTNGFTLPHPEDSKKDMPFIDSLIEFPRQRFAGDPAGFDWETNTIKELALDENIVKSLSYSTSLMSGTLYDQDSTPASTYIFYKRKKASILYTISLSKKWFYDEGYQLFYIPAEFDIRPLFGRGETFHARMMLPFSSKENHRVENFNSVAWNNKTAEHPNNNKNKKLLIKTDEYNTTEKIWKFSPHFKLKMLDMLSHSNIFVIGHEFVNENTADSRNKLLNNHKILFEKFLSSLQK